jgi:DNA repair ATPase RecN
MKVIEYGMKIQKLEKKLKESQQEPHTLNNVREEVARANEELREAQKRLFTYIKSIQDHQDEIISLSDHLYELKRQYTEANHAFDKIIHWHERHEETPTYLFQFTNKEKRKTNMLMDGWKKSCQYVKDTIILLINHVPRCGIMKMGC